MSDKIVGKIVKLSPATTKVSVERVKKHRLYGKQYKITKKFLVDNTKNIGEIGNIVEIIQTKPVSKNKRWKISKIIEGK